MFHLRNIEGSRCPSFDILPEEDLFSFISCEDRKGSYLIVNAFIHSLLPLYDDLVSSLVKMFPSYWSRIPESPLHP